MTNWRKLISNKYHTMKILFCCQQPLAKRLGAPKVYIELHESFSKIGWHSEIVGPLEVCGEERPRGIRHIFPTKFREYLQKRGDEFDVVDYEHSYLPYPRHAFSSQTLLVARSVLLALHMDQVRIPKTRGLKPAIGRLLYGRRRRRETRRFVQQSLMSIREADCINVPNSHDVSELIRRGVPDSKIVMFPFGMTEERRQLFEGISAALPPKPRVAFVGTLDPRKGMCELPEIVGHIARSVPEANFRLLGVAGMLRTNREILNRFPVSLRSRLEVVESFDPRTLPLLLADCSVGIFPSYLEGFPFGVLEMLAACLPVFAYDAPGPPMMLSDEYLSPPGHAMALAAKVVKMLCDREKLVQARIGARQRAGTFYWEEVARATASEYVLRLERRRSLGTAA